MRPERVTIFIDNEAARFAINAGSSASPPMRRMLHAIFDLGAQLLAIRCATEANKWADDLSRGAGDAVFAAARAVFGRTHRMRLTRASEWSELAGAATGAD